MDLDRLRMVLAIGLFLGLDSVPLRPLAPQRGARLGVGTGHGVGPRLGDVAILERLLWLGAASAALLLRRWFWFPLPWLPCRRQL